MNKKIIISLFIGLLILILLTIFLPVFFRSKTQPQYQPQTTKIDQPVDLNTSSVNQTVKQKLPYETSDFKIEYSPTQNKVIATKKTSQADQKIDQWLIENNLSGLKNQPNVFIVKNNINIINQQNMDLMVNPSITMMVTPTADKNAQLLVDLLSILLNIGNVGSSSGNNNSLIPSPLLTISPATNLSPSEKPSKPSGALVYYPQCGGNFDSYPLPSGCTICQAGCGPTTVSMIVASYVDKNVNPKTIVDLYKKKGYLLGCAGSRYGDAKAALASYGIKTTDYLTYSYATINQAADDFKNYIKTGWTIFILANFCDAGCGHFFWITDVTANNDTWAYDPYYGRLQKPPYNEKSRYPFPKYRIAFGVKK